MVAVGDCPQCKGRTFVVRVLSTGQGIGKCYICGAMESF